MFRSRIVCPIPRRPLHRDQVVGQRVPGGRQLTPDGGAGHPQPGRPAAKVRLADIADVATPPGSLDLITARVSLHYLADLDHVVKVAARGLAAGGRFTFTVVHPVIARRRRARCSCCSTPESEIHPSLKPIVFR